MDNLFPDGFEIVCARRHGDARRDANIVYRLTSLIGTGSFADVFAVETNHNEVVSGGGGGGSARKALPRLLCAKVDHALRQTADNFSILQHELLVFQAIAKAHRTHQPERLRYFAEVVDFGKLADGRHFMIMERVGKQTLGDVGVHALPVQFALSCAQQACRALRAVHRAGFVHRDVKPDNFMVEQMRNGCVHLWLIDFGFAKRFVARDGTHIHNAKKEHVTGTLEFLSCHALFGFESSRRCDLESLCYTLAFTLHPNQQLPWSDSIADVREEDMDDAFLTALGHRKHKTDARELFGADTPAHACFRRVLRTARALKFAQAPPFDDLDTVFTDAIAASSPSSHPHSS